MPETSGFVQRFDASIKDEDVITALQSFIDVYRDQKQKNESLSIPLSLFSERALGGLEVVVKYLKENLSLTYAQIAKVINRDPRTVWGTYARASSKQSTPFALRAADFMIPCMIFSNRNRGPLEAIVCYLKDELKLSFRQISRLLNRDYATVWLSYKNGQGTRVENEKKRDE